MQRLAGKHNNTTRYFYQGYFYHLDRRGDGVIFRCASRRDYCPAIAVVPNLEDLSQQPVTLYNTPHECNKENINALLEQRFSEELCQASKNNLNEDLKHIFDRIKEASA